MKDFLTVSKNVQNEIIIEKSRFITTINRVDGEDSAKKFVQSIKSTYPDATHNCYAYIADNGGFYVKFSDDGEPQGTAGLPMLETLKAKGLKQVAVVVTRYFGGVKLGTGGLARAYADCVKKAVEKAGVKSALWSSFLKTEIAYTLHPKLIKIIEGFNGKVISTNYLSSGVELSFAVPSDARALVQDKIVDFSLGKSTVLFEKDGYFEYDI
ncbi:MAG: YigZ family protein [Clostridia bacterium]|nr:YigZ family protein [Clostridia bacterium]